MREMKDSGIEWIGLIPKDWEVCRHKDIMYRVKEIEVNYKGQDIISLTMNGVNIRDLSLGGKIPLTFDGYQKVYQGNLLLCLFDIDVTPRCVGLIKNDGVTSPAYCQFAMHNKVCAPYYDYLLRYIDDNKCMLHLSKNLRNSLTETDFGAIYTIYPPFSTQQRIATFLDEKCKDIDTLITLQEEMIAELQAYKQSVISEAVTKGLNPNVQMKDSGVEWIGEIPRNWSIVPFKSYFLLKKGLNITKADLVANGIPVVNYGQVHSKLNTGTSLKNELIRYVPTMYLESDSNCLVEQGSFVFADTSEDLEGCGNAVYIDSYLNSIFAGYHTIVATSTQSKQNKYLAYLFLTDSWRSQIRSRVTGIKVFSINQKCLRNSTIMLPPLLEQRQIADYLDTKCSQIDELIALKQQKITELQDYKKSLIYEYVTGKKEVPANN